MQIEELLAEAKALSTEPAWERVEQAVRGIVHLYGAGLAQVLEHARTAGAVGATFDHLLAEDDLVASLLVLHALHPLDTEQRVRRVLDRIAQQAGIELSLSTIADGVAYLDTCVPLGRELQADIRCAIESAAPELAGIEIAALAA